MASRRNNLAAKLAKVRAKQHAELLAREAAKEREAAARNKGVAKLQAEMFYAANASQVGGKVNVAAGGEVTP